jgi:RNA polymerase sigma factor for flagellar operon FliA
MTVEELSALRGRVHQSLVLSLDAPSGSSDDGPAVPLGSSIIDAAQLEPADLLAQREQESYLHDALECLPDRMREVVRGYFLDGRSSAELALALGVTESRVSQLRTAALTLMRSGMAAQFGEEPVAPSSTTYEQAAYAAALAGRSSFAARISGPAGQRSSAVRRTA